MSDLKIEYHDDGTGGGVRWRCVWPTLWPCRGCILLSRRHVQRKSSDFLVQRQRNTANAIMITPLCCSNVKAIRDVERCLEVLVGEHDGQVANAQVASEDEDEEALVARR